jgi:hypothetical protein
MMDDDEASFGLTTGQTNIDAIANLSTPWISHSQIFSCVITRFESVSFEKTMVKASSTFATMRRLEMKLQSSITHLDTWSFNLPLCRHRPPVNQP